jgi:N utilization substance protein A
VVERLVAIGMNSLSVLETVEASDLTDAGFTEEEAQKIMARVTK